MNGAVLISLLLLITSCSADEVVEMDNLRIISPAFEHNEEIPSKYTCDGEDINPPLHIEGISQAVSLVLIVDDPDAPMGNWNHWVVWNIAPLTVIEENSIMGVEGMNDFGKHSYGGPCPPSGTHRYFFKVYALNVDLNLSSSAKKEDVEAAMEGHIIGKGEIIGLYKRK